MSRVFKRYCPLTPHIGGWIGCPKQEGMLLVISLPRPDVVDYKTRRGAHDIDLADGLSGDQQLGIDIATVEQMHTGEEMARGQVILNERTHDTIRSGHDAGDQVRLILLTGFGEVQLVANPGDTTLGAIPGLDLMGEAINAAAGSRSCTARQRRGPGGSVNGSAQTCRNI